MRQYIISIWLITLFLTGTNHHIYAQKNIENQIADSLTVIINSYTSIGRVNVSNISINANRVVVTANEKLGNMPFRPDNVKRIYNAIKKVLGSKYSGFSFVCQIENINIEDLIPNFYRTESVDDKKRFIVTPTSTPLLINISKPYLTPNGLTNRHIALWQSHGWHFDQKSTRWKWQRARVFQIVEDLYTQSFILPYLTPMLENAGANVLLPRERDTQTNELIVDNDIKDNQSRYREHNDRKAWKTGLGEGFSNSKKIYLQGENPFTYGTYRTIQTVNNWDESSRIEWLPNFTEAGLYAVYVSYKAVENSVSSAQYTVFHKGGKTDFQVNQTMYGGTWLYLGHFYFGKGRTSLCKVVLTNFSNEDGKIVTADAVKFGGGMGNIARSTYETTASPTQNSSDSIASGVSLMKPTTHYKPEISNYPRFTEGARYWLQWAGMPESVYSKSSGKNDYTDDFQSRGAWVNYMASGSSVIPNANGLNVPIDLAFAFHSDAGTTINDSIIGTLGICSIQNSDGKTVFENGVSRWASRDLTDIIQTQIVTDIRQQFAPEWTRRGLWNKSYSESRTPEVPTMLLELLSHQNFADMRYGLDPRFRFTVSRAIYKGMLKYLSSVGNKSGKTEYVVQPLPVKQVSCKFIENNKLEISWLPVIDSIEPTAVAEKYVLYTRIENGAFDNGVVVNSNKITLNVPTGKIHSYKITALNKGGESFPSEILSAYRSHNNISEVLIVNGFERISAPSNFQIDSTYAGFINDEDPGVPYLNDISFVGKQIEYKRNKPWLDDDSPGFGASYANYETKVIAGNSFDYAYIHGKAIKAAGYSFVSCSVESIVKGTVDMSEYKIIDLILGKQKQTYIGNSKKAAEFKTFPLALQQALKTYTQKGGNLIISGAYIASDLCDQSNPKAEDKLFIENILKYKYRTKKASVGGALKIINSPIKSFKKLDFNYFSTPNAISYYVESPDAIEPSSEGGYTICRYTENNFSAGVAYDGKYKICSFGFPLETIENENDREKIFISILAFFENGKE